MVFVFGLGHLVLVISSAIFNFQRSDYKSLPHWCQPGHVFFFDNELQVEVIGVSLKKISMTIIFSTPRLFALCYETHNFEDSGCSSQLGAGVNTTQESYGSC